jgi:hypothetical protein
VANGAPNTSSTAVLLLCADKPISSASVGAGTVNMITLWGYGGGAGGGQKLALNSGAGTNAAISPTNGNCINVNIPAAQSPDTVGVDLNGFSTITIGQGAVTDTSARGSVQGSLAIAPSISEITPQVGETTGPKLIFIAQPAGAPNSLVYTFNRPLDPNFVTAGSYGYVTVGGVEVPGTSAAVNGATVTITFPGVVNAVRYYVRSGANRTQTQDVPTPGDTAGAAIALKPTIGSVAPVSGVPGAYDVTYDQFVTVADPTKFVALLEDNAGIPVTPVMVTRPGGANMVRITFPSPITTVASKIVKLMDVGGAVVQQSAPSNPSILGQGFITTPPMNYGFTDGPDLTGFSLNASGSTATFCFDGNYGSLAPGLAAGSFHLVNADGSVSAGAATASITAANAVTAQFNPSQVSTAVGGTISAPGVNDFQGIANVFPTTSGIGGNTAACAGGGGGGTTTVTVTTTVTKTVTNTVTVNSAPCVSSKCGTSTTINVSRQGGGNDRVSGRITGSHGYCSGNITIAILKNGNQVGSKTTGLDNNCGYGTTIHVGSRSGKKLQAHFGGNGFLKSSNSGKVNA